MAHSVTARVQQWIAATTPNKHFADIGGIGENSGNERVTYALSVGARTVSMVDCQPFGSPQWERFREIAQDKHVAMYPDRDITRPTALLDIGPFDVIHSTGVLYHVSDPLAALINLRRATREHLIINTVTIPNEIKNAAGQIKLCDGAALWIPGTPARERTILQEHYRRKFGWDINLLSPLPDAQRQPYILNDEIHGAPWWWFPTDVCFRNMIRLAGLRILEEFKWEDHCLFALTEPGSETG